MTTIGPYELDTVHCADALDWLRTLPDGCVNCIVTSPPYFGLRDYGVVGQLGLEPTLRDYLDRLTAVFSEARRVLRDDGVAWVNMGDSYAGSGAGGGGNRKGNEHGQHDALAVIGRPKASEGVVSKSLLGVPWRLAFALQDAGWILRSDCIWHKPNPMPESVTDRPTKAHEYVFLLSKMRRYWYDADAVREPSVYGQGRATFLGGTERLRQANVATGGLQPSDRGMKRPAITDRNLRTVWTVATEPTHFAHFATFPRALVRRCVLAGCPATVCATCGAPWVRVVERETTKRRDSGNGSGLVDYGMYSGRAGDTVSITLGFAPTCACNAATRPGVVLDPFMGSGTTALVARSLGRHYIGCDLNPEYVALAQRRLAEPYTLALPIDAGGN